MAVWGGADVVQYMLGVWGWGCVCVFVWGQVGGLFGIRGGVVMGWGIERGW
jgi:hypothetical protein